MLIAAILLTIIAFVALFLRIRRRRAVRVDNHKSRPNFGYSVSDHPCAFTASSGYWLTSETFPTTADGEIFAFEGGDGGAGESFDSSDNNPAA